MKKAFILSFFSFFLFLVIQACRNEQTSSKATTSPAKEQAVKATDIPISERLQSLGLTEQGHWRSVRLGDSLTTVKNTETAKLFESDDSHLGYSLEFPNMESVDILYYQKGRKISAIDIDLYLNTRQSVANYTADLEKYFTARFGKPIQEEKALVWTGTQQEKISVKDVSEGKDFGVKVKVMAARDRMVTASASR